MNTEQGEIKPCKTVDVIRGLVCTIGENKSTQAIYTVEYIYLINEVMKFQLQRDYKLLGVIANDKFNICCDITLYNNDKAFGYFVSCKNKIYNFQKINGFNKFLYNPYEATYSLGEEIKISTSFIKDIEVDFKAMYKTEFYN